MTNQAWISNPNRTDLRKFGIVMFFPLSIIGGLKYVFHPEQITSPAIWCGIGVLFLLSGLVIPSALKWFYQVWMAFAHYLGIASTYIILSVSFFVAFTLMGLILKIVGKDLLDTNWSKRRSTYWHDHDLETDRPLRWKQPY